MESSNNILYEYENLICNIYKEYQLQSLHKMLPTYAQHIAQCATNIPESSLEIEFHFDRLIYSWSCMVAYNISNDTYKDNKTGICCWTETIYSKRYEMYRVSAYESFYNFWNRIAILINDKCNFISSEKWQLTFPKLIDKISKQNIEDENLTYLIKFKENEFKQINLLRKKSVHRKTERSEYFNQFVSNPYDDESLPNIDERQICIKMIKGSIDSCINGFESACKFIESYALNKTKI